MTEETISLTDEQLLLLKQVTEPNSKPALFAKAIEHTRALEKCFEELTELDPKCRHLVNLAKTCEEFTLLDFHASLPGVYRLIRV